MVGAVQSGRRDSLFTNLEEAIQDLLRNKIRCEVWIDGSFLTVKLDPDDVDFLVLVDADFAEEMTPAQKALLARFNQPAYLPGLDTFADTHYPRGHEFADLDQDERTWSEQYGLETGNFWLKGFVVLRLWETDVGLRIRR